MQSIIQSGLAEQTINKSRFIALAAPCESEREVASMLRSFAIKHPHAHHLAFAYQIKTADGMIQRMNDAGEPSGTAGRPILQHMEGQKLVNACVAVIRYYGGINLGTGGLARAYGSTAKLAIEAARLTPYVEMTRVQFDIDYARLDSLSREIAKINGKIINKSFGELVSIQASIPASEAQSLCARFRGG